MNKSTKEDYTIIGIIPADGWFARYKNDDGVLLFVKVACFALVEWSEGTRDVQPMDWSDSYMDLCINTSNFDEIEYSPDRKVID